MTTQKPYAEGFPMIKRVPTLCDGLTRYLSSKHKGFEDALDSPGEKGFTPCIFDS